MPPENQENRIPGIPGIPGMSSESAKNLNFYNTSCMSVTLQKPEKKHEKQLIAKFRARILITEGFELMEQQLNHGKALKKFRESMKNLDNFFKG